MPTKPLTPTQTATRQKTLIEVFTRAAARVGYPKDAVKLSIANGYFPTPKQLRFHANCYAADDPGFLPMDIGYGGTRGPGKTHALFMQAVQDCQRFAELKVLFLRKVGKYATEGMDDLRRRTLSRVPHKKARSTIVFPNDSRIIVGSYRTENDIDNYLSLEYDVILIEQAEQLTKEKIESIRTVCRTSKPGWRARMYYTFNPGGVGHTYLKTLFIEPWRENRETDTRFTQGLPGDNPFLPQEYVENVLKKLTGWKRKAWLEGNWDIAAGQFFTNFRYDKHVVDPDDFPWYIDPDTKQKTIPKNAQIWGSFDYGFRHYSCFYLFAKLDGVIWTIAEHADRMKLVPFHADRIKALLGRYHLTPDDLSKIVAGHDTFSQKGSSDGRTVGDQYEDEGLYMSPANIDRISGAANILEKFGMEAEDDQPAIEPTVMISTNCARLIECIPALEHNPKRPEDVLKIDTDDDGHGGDDPYDAWRYGLMEESGTGVWL